MRVFTDASGTSVDDIETQQQSTVSQQKQIEGNQEQPARDVEVQDKPSNSRGQGELVPRCDRLVTHIKEKDHQAVNASLGTNQDATVADNETQKGEDMEATDGASGSSRSVSSSSHSPYRLRRRRQSGNRSEERRPRGEQRESSDYNSKGPNLCSRGRERKREEVKPSDRSGDEQLHQTLQNLESRCTAIENVTRDLQKMLMIVLNNPAQQQTLSSTQEKQNDQAGCESALDLKQNQRQRHQQQSMGEILTSHQDAFTEIKAETRHMHPVQTNLYNISQDHRQPIGLRQQQQQQQQYHQEQQNSSIEFAACTPYNMLSDYNSKNPKPKLGLETLSTTDIGEDFYETGHANVGEKLTDNKIKATDTASLHANIQGLNQKPQDGRRATSMINQGQNNLSIDFAPYQAQGSSARPRLLEDVGEGCAESDSSNSSDALGRNITEETKCLQECLKWVTSSNAKVDAMSDRLDQVMSRLETKLDDQGYTSGAIEHTEPKTVYPTSRDASDQFQGFNNVSYQQLLSGIRETLQTEVELSIKMQSIYTEAQIKDMQEQMTRKIQDNLQIHVASTSHVLERLEEVQRLYQHQILKDCCGSISGRTLNLRQQIGEFRKRSIKLQP
ncbi:LOW QUALITY PROTEIN: hypothetical protein ElyMa_001807500 [Elysia marginata]|uniref:Uncharacterized protein n=1 Tax=Elysia marginata TaxID=1093978 RepID=A0AAV4EFU8_9GAST|nr:LOW QUALITY PROTEIN: hypothetical protein ElyMa_001807500 [Elysia marginata]